MLTFFLRNVLLENIKILYIFFLSITNSAKLKMWMPSGWKLYMTLAFSHLQSARELKINK